MSKLKLTLTGFMLPLILLFGSPKADSRNPATTSSHGQTGTLQKMIVENGSVALVGSSEELLGNEHVRRAYLGL